MNKFSRYFLVISLAVFVSNAIAEIDVIKTAQQLNPKRYMFMEAVPEKDKLAELSGYQQQLNSELAVTPESPQLWWLTGLHAWSVLYAWDDPVPLDKNRAQKKIAMDAFRKALELDKIHEPHLTRDMLYSLKTFGSSDVHVEVAQRILDESPVMEQRDEIEMRGGMITHFLELERYEDVIKQAEIIEQKYPDSEYGKGAREHSTKIIEKIKLEKQTAIQDVPAQPATSSPTTIIEPATENPNPNSETNTTDTTSFIKYQPHWLWYVLILGAVIGIAGVMFARRKK